MPGQSLWEEVLPKDANSSMKANMAKGKRYNDAYVNSTRAGNSFLF